MLAVWQGLAVTVQMDLIQLSLSIKVLNLNSLSLSLSVPLLLSSEPFLSYTTDLPVGLKLCQPNLFLAIFFNSLKLQSDARTTSSDSVLVVSCAV